MINQSDTPLTKSPTQTARRLAYLDTLRVLAVFLVFMFHANKAFTVGDWHVKNDEISMVASIVYPAFLAPWGMPFFFVLAGAGTWFALQRRTGRQFAQERTRRLLIPYLVGSAILSPIQCYFEWQYHVRTGEFSGSYLEWFLSLFGGWNPTIASWIGYHLWFLLFLFLFSLLALPLLIWLRDKGQGFINGIIKVWQFRGGLLLFAIPPLLIQVIFRPIFPGAQNWADFFFDLYFFLSGYLLFSDKRFEQVIRRDRWLELAGGILAFIGLLATLIMGNAEELFSNPEAAGYQIFWGIAAVDAWCFSIFMLYIGMRFLDFSNRWTRYGQEAVVPFYMLHQPVIIAIAFYVVLWPVNIWIKISVVVLSSFFITIALYEVLVRRLPPLRALVGMKASPAKSG